MPEGGILTVESERVAGEWSDVHRIRFSDTGVGIPPEVRERVFEPFFTTKDGGTGLGLPTVDRIVTEHEGRIVLDTEMERGTTFVVEFPVYDETVSFSDTNGDSVGRSITTDTTVIDG